MARTSVSTRDDWNVRRFAKAPYEILSADYLSATTRLLWIFLYGRADHDEIEKGTMDRGLAINRSTRIRCMNELKSYGFISGTENHIILNDPYPIFKKIRDEQHSAMQYLEEHLYDNREEEKVIRSKPAKPKDEAKSQSVSYFTLATSAWNSYRPQNYSKINRMSSQLLKAIDLHIDALGIKKHDYEQFFSTLKSGVDHSPFWSKENTSKTLQSIIGLGQPQTKKYQNVYSLYNEGLNYDKSEAIMEEDRQDQVIIPDRLRKLIDEYDELHYLYYNLSCNDPDQVHILDDRILKVESQFKDEKLDPARFRMKYQLDSWPSDIPEPETPRQRFWIYDTEV